MTQEKLKKKKDLGTGCSFVIAKNLNFIFEGAVNDTSSAVETLQHSMYMTGKITT